MTPEELSAICKNNGGQAAVAKKLPCTKDHMNKMCRGVFPITDKTANTINLLYPASGVSCPQYLMDNI